MVPRLEQLEDRSAPSAAFDQFALAYSDFVIGLAQQELVMELLAPPAFQPLVTAWIGAVNQAFSNIPPVVIPLLG